MANGLYTDFEAYRIPRETEVREALRDGLVAIDTNVLLSLYRYNDSTVEDLLELLRKLGDRLFIPHQVLREFWRNRRVVLGNPASSRAEALKLLEKSRSSSVSTIERWAKQVALPSRETDALSIVIDDAFAEVRNRLDAIRPPRVSATTPTDEDRVLITLEQILDGKVGQAFDDERQERETTEGNRRVEEEIPPGYKDSDKLDSDNPERAAGDYLVWAQLIDEAARRQLDLVLVTGDVKEDWWERGPLGTLIGPRKELIAEFREKAAGRVHLLEPSAFLRASAALDVEINPLSVEDVERVRDETVPWTAEAVRQVLQRLQDEELAQAEVILAAADAGGRVERTDVYRIAGRTDGRMLTGFTRPVARVTRELQAAGVVPEGVLPLLSSWYERGVRATHFIVPEEVVEMALR